MRICPEFPCDNPDYACASLGSPRFVLARETTPAVVLAHEADEAPREILPEPTSELVNDADVHAAVRPSGVFLLGAGEEALGGACVEEEIDASLPAFELLESLEALEQGDDLEVVEPFDMELMPAIRELAGERAEMAVALFEWGEVPEDPRAHTALVLAGAVDAGYPARTSKAFRTALNGWRAVLRGDLDDIGACGGRMLDEWVAEIVAAILGTPERSPELRRALRNHGVCAFGLVRAA